jgi:hypothetical protein
MALLKARLSSDFLPYINFYVTILMNKGMIGMIVNSTDDFFSIKNKSVVYFNEPFLSDLVIASLTSYRGGKKRLV